MGLTDEQLENRDKKRALKGATAGGPRFTRKSKAVADWESVNDKLLLKAVATVAAQDGALRLGYTRDGGAFAIGIYGDGDPFTEYVSPGDDIESFLEALIAHYGKG